MSPFDWRGFFAALQRRVGAAGTTYVHGPSAVAYVCAGDVGRGCYGMVRKFGAVAQADAASAGLPTVFCVKTVADALDEVTAFLRLAPFEKQGHRLVVEGAVLRTWQHRGVIGADIGMRLYSGTMARYTEANGADAETACTLGLMVARAVLRLWVRGIAYCDIKSDNVLLLARSGHLRRVVLGDVGSAVCCGSGVKGLFSFPPRRAFEPPPGVDGIVEPTEADLVWGLGTLLLSMLLGGSWVNSRFGATVIRERGVRLGALELAFDDLAAEARARLAKLCGARGDAATARAAAAAEVALEAWEGRRGATLVAFCDALRDRETGWESAARGKRKTCP